MRTLAIVCCAAVQFLFAQPQPRWRALYEAVQQAGHAKDYPKLRQALAELRPAMPGNAQIVYNLAACEAKLGNRDAALDGLRALGRAGLVFDSAADADFAALAGSSDFAAVQKQMDANRRPIARARFAFALSEPDLIPEDIAYDAKTSRFFVSSIRKGKILASDGKEFARSKWPVSALAIDPERRLLWASTGWMIYCEKCDEGDRGKTALLAFALDTGALVRRVDSPDEGVLSDMTIGRHGDVYVSNSTSGAVYRLAPDAAKLERIDPPGEFPSPQTPALSVDEKTLYVPDYARGIAAIDLRSRAVRWLTPRSDIALSGIDGLYVYRNSFIAVQNGVEPKRIVRLSRDLTGQEVLEAGSPGLGEPTHGVVVGKSFYFIANTGWDRYDRDGKKTGSEPVRSSVRQVDLE